MLSSSTGRADALYFSVITQTTIGYGDIQPSGTARLVAAAQGIVGVVFTILVLGRVVALLPRIESVITYPGDENATPAPHPAPSASPSPARGAGGRTRRSRRR